MRVKDVDDKDVDEVLYSVGILAKAIIALAKLIDKIKKRKAPTPESTS